MGMGKDVANSTQPQIQALAQAYAPNQAVMCVLGTRQQLGRQTAAAAADMCAGHVHAKDGPLQGHACVILYAVSTFPCPLCCAR